MASVFKKILCPVDLDGSAPSALTLAAELAREKSAEVHVLHVVPMILQAGEMPMFVDLHREQEAIAKARLAELVSKLSRRSACRRGNGRRRAGAYDCCRRKEAAGRSDYNGDPRAPRLFAFPSG